MNAMVILLVSIVILVAGYVLYGGWLARQWGVDDNRVTPSHEFEDGVDYVPAKPYVVLGHHFSSIAGAGPINGPIQAAVFGWLPVLLWVLIGGIFFGAMHDFGALFASIRHKGQTLASVIQENIDDTAKKLFCIFAYLTLILVVAAFASIVAGTFAVVPDASGAIDTSAGSTNLANMRTAMISMLFIVAAIIWGLATRGRNIPAWANILAAIVVIVVVVTVGYLFPVFELGYTPWMYIVGAYILIASVAPVWILLQPRDYLSSYLLYGMIALSLIGIVGAGITGHVSNLDIPAFTGFTAEVGDSKVATSGFLFPALFITIACGAISGFHSLVASGTTSKQIDREGQAQADCLRRYAPRVPGRRHLAVRRRLRVWRLHGRHLRHAHRGLRGRPVADARVHPRPVRCRGRRVLAAHPCRLGVLPHLARHRDAPGPLHVPGALHPGGPVDGRPDRLAQVLREPLGRHRRHGRPGHRARPDRLPARVAPVRRRQPAARRARPARSVRLARQRAARTTRCSTSRWRSCSS